MGNSAISVTPGLQDDKKLRAILTSPLSEMNPAEILEEVEIVKETVEKMVVEEYEKPLTNSANVMTSAIENMEESNASDNITPPNEEDEWTDFTAKEEEFELEH